MQIRDVRSLKRNCSLNHCVKQNTQRPNVGTKPLIASVNDNLWGEVSWRSTLLMDTLPFLYKAGNAEIAKFNTAVSIH